MEVGYRCRACIGRQQQVFYADFRPYHYLIAVLVALPLALIGGWLVPTLGWFFAVFLSPLVGTGITEAVRWAVGRRRGRYLWLVVSGSIVVGALPWLAMSLFPLAVLGLDGGVLFSIGRSLLAGVIYLFGAAGTAIAYLRLRRRR
jgi:hypothetical protein